MRNGWIEGLFLRKEKHQPQQGSPTSSHHLFDSVWVNHTSRPHEPLQRWHIHRFQFCCGYLGRGCRFRKVEISGKPRASQTKELGLERSLRQWYLQGYKNYISQVEQNFLPLTRSNHHAKKLYSKLSDVFKLAFPGLSLTKWWDDKVGGLCKSRRIKRDEHRTPDAMFWDA